MAQKARDREYEIEHEAYNTETLFGVASSALLDALSKLGDSEASDTLNGVITMLDDRRAALASALQNG